MKRRNFFKKIVGVIAGLAVAPFVTRATVKESIKFVPDENFHGQSTSYFVPNGDWKWVNYGCNDKFVPMHIEELPGIRNGKKESKAQFEQRKKALPDPWDYRINKNK